MPEITPEISSYFAQIAKIGHKVKSDKRTQANRQKAREYWEKVKAGLVVHKGRGKNKTQAL